jgi:4-alpha-glucanotransferase
MVAADVTNAALHARARAAGIFVQWRDALQNVKTVPAETLRAVLDALDGPNVETHVAESPVLITADVGRAVTVAGRPGLYRLTLEAGGTVEGVARPRPAGVVSIRPVYEPGYHRLEIGGRNIILAVAPREAFTIDDVACGERLWGLAVQLYALRRAGDGGVGDFAALREFVRAAGACGSDAVAISPVHAQFAADPSRFSPYAPSSRAAFNVLHIGLDMGGHPSAALIDWPAAAAARFAALRTAFQSFSDWDKLAAFRNESGIGLQRHVTFEALQSALVRRDPAARDWRHWRPEYHNPESSAVHRFLREHAADVNFHAYLQYRAGQDYAAAQSAAREVGMRIGLIGDLAVGTDPAGSHSWSRPDEVLKNLEIGAPPDSFNQEGQGWGITAFSPSGLRRSGYAAFIEMLRHAMRHTGGVRIDHIMGFSRLWVIPKNAPPSAGAYLRMPMHDLLRLTRLESHRHKAVVLGEDLGTLPAGFREQLTRSGIAGLRVMWFEKSGAGFKPPARWTRQAAAMTTTHDLPTVAGWWRGQDISWRQKLGRAGDDRAAREKERAALWRAFRKSGVTRDKMPGPENAAAVADAACVYLGHAASQLALLPIEDALGTVEQPNLPGTTDEHPNWRRRLPDESEALFQRPDVAARLAGLARARRLP